MAFKTWTYGETPVASADLNGNFTLVAKEATSTSSIPAAEVNSAILVFVSYEATDSSNNAGTFNLSLDIGGSQKQTKKVFEVIAGGSTKAAVGGTHMFKYSPTSGEKSAGFTVGVSTFLTGSPGSMSASITDILVF